MIEGFDDYTCELGGVEEELLPLIVASLKKHDCKSKAITNQKMREGLKLWLNNRLLSMVPEDDEDEKSARLKVYENGISDARMRKIIHYIQLNGLLPGLVSAGTKGYYVTKDIEEIKRYVESLRARCNSILEVAEAVSEQFGLDADENEEQKEYEVQQV